jgi:hypothetical protein
MQDDEKAFIWVLEIPKPDVPEKILFSASGRDREKAAVKTLVRQKNSWVHSGSGSLPSE